MARRAPPQRGWRETLLGGKDSWRRVVLTGLGAGFVLAAVAAIAVAFIGDGGGGKLDSAGPTAIAPASGPGGPPVTVPDELPTEEPIIVPTEPIEVPTEPELPTEPAPEPTAAPTEAPLPTDPPVQGAQGEP